jgi:hypothetical protein
MSSQLDMGIDVMPAISKPGTQTEQAYLISLLADAVAIELPQGLAVLLELLIYICRIAGTGADSAMLDSAYRAQIGLLIVKAMMLREGQWPSTLAILKQLIPLARDHVDLHVEIVILYLYFDRQPAAARAHLQSLPEAIRADLRMRILTADCERFVSEFFCRRADFGKDSACRCHTSGIPANMG